MYLDETAVQCVRKWVFQLRYFITQSSFKAQFGNTNRVRDQLNEFQSVARLEQAFCVLAFHETKAVVRMQRQFRRKYGKSP
jgi:hypothetical protein